MCSIQAQQGNSRKKLLEAIDLKKNALSYNYTGIEPFTIIAASWGPKLDLFELVWGREEETLQNPEKRGPSLVVFHFIYQRDEIKKNGMACFFWAKK